MKAVAIQLRPTVNWPTPNHQPNAAPRRKAGRCTHIATLEPERWATQVAIWDGERRAGNVWKAFEKKHAGLEILNVEEAKASQDIADAVRADETAKKYVSAGKAEVTVLWRDAETGIDCKCRPDFIADCGALVDLKTTRDASPEGFGKEVWRYRLPVGSSATPMTYISPKTGRQYVLVSVGGAAHSKDVGDYVIAFSIPQSK